MIGEHHDNYAHHLYQLQYIKALKQKGAKIAIGMEMFQRPFQNVLDDYIAGRIDEKTFLKRSEYFSRWGYDYKLYRPIMIYAKEEHIPIIALNLDKNITQKVSKYGLSALTKKETDMIPKELDMQDSAYKKRLLKIYNNPKHRAYLPNADYFYQAQILWDETMAESIARYLQNHPDTIMIVLVGNGHLAYFSGIPNRLKKRVKIPFKVILQDSDKAPHKADIYHYPKPIMIEPTPKLGVTFKPRSLEVKEVTKDSLAEKLGIKKADTLLMLNDLPLKDIGDLRLGLYIYHDSDSITLRLRRDNQEITLP